MSLTAFDQWIIIGATKTRHSLQSGQLLQVVLGPSSACENCMSTQVVKEWDFQWLTSCNHLVKRNSASNYMPIHCWCQHRVLHTLHSMGSWSLTNEVNIIVIGFCAAPEPVKIISPRKTGIIAYESYFNFFRADSVGTAWAYRPSIPGRFGWRQMHCRCFCVHQI